MAYTNPYTVEDKEDSAEKTAFAAGKPTKHFLFGLEFNGIKSAFATLTGWINSLLSSKEDKVSGVIAFGSDNYTATIPNVTELLDGHKMLFLFENPNTGASTLNPNELGAIEIVKEGDVQLVANDLLGVHWLMYDGEKLQVVGHVPAPTDTFQKKATASTGNTIQFDTDRIYNSIASPTTGTMTNNLTGAQIGVIQKIYYNHSTANPFPAGWVRLGSKTYTPSALNIIYAEWVGASRVEYWISQEA